MTFIHSSWHNSYLDNHYKAGFRNWRFERIEVIRATKLTIGLISEPNRIAQRATHKEMMMMNEEEE